MLAITRSRRHARPRSPHDCPLSRARKRGWDFDLRKPDNTPYGVLLCKSFVLHLGQGDANDP